MAEKEIDKFLEKLGELWKKHPDQRFGQLLFNYTRFGTRLEIGQIIDPFHYQDKDILSDIQKSIEGGKDK